MPSANTARSASTAVTDAPSLSSTPFSVSALAAYAWAFSENGARTTSPWSTSVIVAALMSRSWYRSRHHLVDHVGEGSGCLHAGGAGADDHEVEAPPVRGGSGRGRRLRTGAGSGCGGSRVVERRVQREGVLGRSGNAEEVRLGAHRHHEMITGERVAVRRGDGSRVDVDRDDLGELDVHGLVLAEQTAQRAHHVARGKLGRGDLVQQRLELVVRVLVDQGDRHAGLAEFLGAGDAGEPGADDDDACRRVAPSVEDMPVFVPFRRASGFGERGHVAAGEEALVAVAALDVLGDQQRDRGSSWRRSA